MRIYRYRRAGAVVVDRGGTCVLLASMQPPGQRRWWHFPGGGVEDGETAQEAAIRELYEETGLVAHSVQPFLRAGIHGGHHEYFLVDCADLTIGAVTGPELEYAADADFRIEWVPIEDLPSMPVFPRCVAERLASIGTSAVEPVPWVEDDRSSWDGVAGEQAPAAIRVVARAVVERDGRVAAIERCLGDERWFTLPGGGVAGGETVEVAAAREVLEETGLTVAPVAKLAVVVFQRPGRVSLQTYLSCRCTGGELGPGSGGEYEPARIAERGTYRPVWIDPASPPTDLRPAWLADRLPGWLAEPQPERPERFVEAHDG